ncbi:MAG TPA: hypothetical protein VGQ83_23870 [Polyangia bacterium]|jgi:hypothetical protein
MTKTLAAAVAFALLTLGLGHAAAQVPPVQVFDAEEVDEAAPPAPPAPRVLPRAPAPRLQPPTVIVVQCEQPPCPATVAPAPAPVPAPLPLRLPRAYLDQNFRKQYKLGLGLEIMGPAYTIGLAGHWNLTSTFGVSATFGFVGPQVLTLQARLMPLDGKWTPYVAGGVSFLLNPGWDGHSYSSCMAPSYGDYTSGYSCNATSSKTGDDFIFKGTNVVPSFEVGVMVLTSRGFSAQLGFTFYVNGNYREDLGVLTVPWPKVGLAWYF